MVDSYEIYGDNELDESENDIEEEVIHVQAK